jgi:hypothetical protein
LLACVSIWVLVACSGRDAGGGDAERDDAPPDGAAGSVERVEWSSLGEIAYVVADDLPEGWSLSHATLRPGRPADEWAHHFEILSTPERDRFLIVGAGTVGGDGPAAPGEVEAVDVDDFMFHLTFTVGAFPADAAAAQVEWQENGLSLFVAEVAAEPDADLIASVAEDLRGLGDLDFDAPRPPSGSGYEPVAASPGDTNDVADYSVVWRPDALAGDDRESGEGAGNEGPTMFINVGSAFYSQAAIAAGTPTSPAEAELQRDGDLLDLVFVLDGSVIRATGSGVDEAELRAFADGLRVVSRDEWADALGSRLLVDEPEP